jgi:hypothetical protein
MIKTALPALAACLFLAACATTNQQSQLDPKILNEFTSRGVSQATVFRVREGLPLSVAQVAECAQKGVPGPGLVSYMQSTRKAYNLSNADLAALRQAGTPAPVINYMQRSYGYYTKGPQAVAQSHPYYTDDRYNLEAPFAYAPPQVDTFFDSGYEESLYSPFSFN